MRYALIDQHRKQWSLRFACEALAVSVSGYYRWRKHPGRFGRLKLYFDCGDHDRYGFQEGAETLHQKLASKDFAHEYALRPGDHGWSYLSQYMKYSLLFHWRVFEQAERSLAARGQAGGTR